MILKSQSWEQLERLGIVTSQRCGAMRKKKQLLLPLPPLADGKRERGGPTRASMRRRKKRLHLSTSSFGLIGKRERMEMGTYIYDEIGGPLLPGSSVAMPQLVFSRMTLGLPCLSTYV